MPAHGLVYLSGDLIFQKSNPGSNEPYQLQSLTEAIRRYETGRYGGGNLSLLRPIRIFPEVKSLDYAAYEDINTLGEQIFFNISFAKDAMNKFYLPKENFSPLLPLNIKKFGQIKDGGYIDQNNAYVTQYNGKSIFFLKCPNVANEIIATWPSFRDFRQKAAIPSDAIELNCKEIIWGDEAKSESGPVSIAGKQSKDAYLLKFKKEDKSACIITPDHYAAFVKFSFLQWKPSRKFIAADECDSIYYWRIKPLIVHAEG